MNPKAGFLSDTLFIFGARKSCVLDGCALGLYSLDVCCVPEVALIKYVCRHCQMSPGARTIVLKMEGEWEAAGGFWGRICTGEVWSSGQQASVSSPAEWG
jgi:hypothetical protein